MGFALASHFTLLLFPDTPQLPASFTTRNGFFPFPLSGFPRVQLPAQGPAPVASVAGSTLGAIHSGKPPICSLPGHGPKEVRVEKRSKAGKGEAVGRAHLSFWKQRSLSGPFPGPLSLPMLSSRPSIQGPGLTVSGDRNEHSSAGPARAIGIWSSVSPSTFHAYIVFIPHLRTCSPSCLPFFPLPTLDTVTILVLLSMTALASAMGP